MKTIKVKWVGIRPLLMNNGIMADPLNPNVRAVKEITSKGQSKMTLDDHATVERYKYLGSLYMGDKGPVIPSDNIERCIQLGAQKSKKGKELQAACYCVQTEVPLEYDGPKAAEKLYDSGKFVLKKGVVIARRRIMGIRPMFPTGWSITFDLEFDETVLNLSSITKAMLDAGTLIGLGDWRPKFGRFLPEVL